jgi:glycosyltransferase involved in cell wall biosynthesis
VAEALGVAFDVTLHDYFAICPRVHLVDPSGRYCGVPDAGVCGDCVARAGSELGPGVDVAAHRERFRALLQRARRVFVPSRDAALRLAPLLPGVRLLVRPHFEDWTDAGPAAALRRPGDELRVAVVGAIGPHKGSEVLLACLRDAARRRLPLRFVVIGYTDRDEDLLATGRAELGGAYEEAELFARLRAARCHCAFFPAVWPETHCFTLSAAMRAGLLPVAFDLGAQAERIGEAGFGVLLPLDAPEGRINDTLLGLQLPGTGEHAGLKGGPEYPEFWRDYYEAPFAIDRPGGAAWSS